MIIIRLIPVILSNILLAAHFLRFYGLLQATLILLLLFSLLIRRAWVIRLWQGFLIIAALVWIETTVALIHARIALNMPWIRMTVIMGAVVLFTVFAGFWLENTKIREYFKSSIRGQSPN